MPPVEKYGLEVCLFESSLHRAPEWADRREEAVKGGAVVGVAQVADFVGDHVIDANRRSVDEFGIEGDDAVATGAAPALGHATEADAGDGQASVRTPFVPCRDALFELIASPFAQPTVQSGADGGFRGHGQGDVKICPAQRDMGWCAVGDLQAVLFSEVPVGGPVDIAWSRMRGIHCSEFAALAVNPMKAFCNASKDVGEIGGSRCDELQ